jgi:hypothetical protein
MEQKNDTTLSDPELGIVLISMVGGGIVSVVLTETVLPGPVKDSKVRDEVLADALELGVKARQAEEFAAKIEDNEGLINISNSYKDQAVVLKDGAPNPNAFGTNLEIMGSIFLAPALTYAALKIRAIRRAKALHKKPSSN